MTHKSRNSSGHGPYNPSACRNRLSGRAAGRSSEIVLQRGTDVAAVGVHVDDGCWHAVAGHETVAPADANTMPPSGGYSDRRRRSPRGQLPEARPIDVDFAEVIVMRAALR